MNSGPANRTLHILTSAALVIGLVLLAVTGPGLRADEPQVQRNPISHIDRAGYVPPSDPGPGGSGPVGLPAAYSLVPAGVTPVKDQGACGSCWAFATYGSMESSIKWTTGVTADLSENHLKNYHGFDWGPCTGGNSWISTAYLSRLDGPVAEASDPYHPWDDRPSPGGPRQYFLSGAPWYTTVAKTKQALMSQGALYTHMYFASAYYNPGTYTYYYSGSADINHAVSIVGWDDTKVVPGAPAAGAWQIKNSWGAGWGQNGYFWVSYADTQAGKFNVSFQAAPPETVQRVYSYDYFGDVNEVNCPYGLNVFRTQQAEQLKSVGFYTQMDNAIYTIKILDKMLNGSPTGLLAQKAGTMADSGFHVVDLDSLVSLGASDDFVVYLYLQNGGSYPQAIDYRVAGYNSSSTANPGESYYSFDGVTWTDITTWDATANFSIKAYTVPEPATLALVAAGFVLLIRRRSR